MESKTNIQAVQDIAINLLNIPVTKKDLVGFGIISHPFFNSSIIPFNDELIDIFENKEKFHQYVKNLKEHIKQCEEVWKIMLLVNKPYRIFFLFLIKDYLEINKFSELLKECYTETEYPNKDVNVSVEQIKNMFATANTDFLMDKDEKIFFNSFEDTITIYRGFSSKKYYNALSWTIDINVAKFFATRFANTNGCIYQATIKKSDIFAYIDSRNEKEVIVDYDKLYDIKKVQKKS